MKIGKLDLKVVDEIFKLTAQMVPQRRIAVDLGISRSSIRRYLGGSPLKERQKDRRRVRQLNIVENGVPKIIKVTRGNNH